MPTIRSAVLAAMFTGLACGPAPAATCSLTVTGSSVLDGVPCAVETARGVTTVAVGAGGTILVRRSIMSVRLPADASSTGRHGGGFTSYGQVTISADPDDKTCYFNQQAVLCVE